MALFGDLIVYVVMLCALAGALASILKPESEMGKEFLEGIYAIGHIFVPVAGIMASLPFLSAMVRFVFGPAFAALKADPSIAATSLIAVDMGGYQLAETLAQSKESWIMAMVVGYMAGATIVFSIPVGLALLKKEDHKYMALGVMSGLLSIPVGVFVTCAVLSLTSPMVRSSVSTQSQASYVLALPFTTIFANLAPLLIFVLAVACGLRFVPRTMIRGFMAYGRLMDAAIKLVLVASVIEHFTGFFRRVLGGWGFNPIVADAADQFRALEAAGNIGLMLCGAFPMVYLIKKFAAQPMQKLGARLGLESVGTAGLIATVANILAMYRLVGDMRAKDKVLNIAFAVCAAFLFGDHLAFTANFQPTLLLPILVGKIAGGVFAFALANVISVPAALALESQQAL